MRLSVNVNTTAVAGTILAEIQEWLSEILKNMSELREESRNGLKWRLSVFFLEWWYKQHGSDRQHPTKRTCEGDAPISVS